MKKNFFVTCLLMFCIAIVQAQDYRFDLGQSNYSIMSPETFKMQEYGYLPDNRLFNGCIPFDIPIHTIKSGNIDFPISLQYSTTGLKATGKSTSLGLDWFLMANACVTTQVRGYRSDYNKGITTKESGGAYYKGSGNEGKYDMDMVHDIYSITGCGLNESFKIAYTEGRFCCVKLKNTESYITLEHSNDKVANDDFYIGKIKVETNSGLVYEFIPTELVISYFGYINYFDKYVSAWSLSKLYDKNTGRELTFEYDDYILEREENPSEFTSEIGNRPELKNYSGVRTKRLTKIKWDDGVIEFVYSGERRDVCGYKDSGLFSDLYKPETERKVIPLLSSIRVNSRDGKILKQLVFNQSYFQKKSPKSYYDYRLRLDGIKILGAKSDVSQSYSFDYYTNSSIDFPTRKIGGTSAVDDFGYFNNNEQDLLLDSELCKVGNTAYPPYIMGPELYSYPQFRESKSFNNNFTLDFSGESHLFYYPFKISGENYSGVKVGRNIEPNFDACVLGCLKKVVLPTGGYYEFEYELNNFNIKVGPIGKKYFYPYKGAGLRIKNQIKSDGITVNKKGYEYEINGKNCGFISKYPTFFDDSYTRAYPSLTPIAQNGFIVGYNKVKVKEDGNGYKIYEFNIPEKIFAPFLVEYLKNPYYSKLDSDVEIIRDDDKDILFPLVNPMIGLLINEQAYNNNNKIILETRYEYDEKMEDFEFYDIECEIKKHAISFLDGVKTSFKDHLWYPILKRKISLSKIDGIDKYNMIQTNYYYDEYDKNHIQQTAICKFNPLTVEYFEKKDHDKYFKNMERKFRIQKEYYTWNVPSNYPLLRSYDAELYSTTQNISLPIGRRFYKGKLSENNINTSDLVDCRKDLTNRDIEVMLDLNNNVKLVSSVFNQYILYKSDKQYIVKNRSIKELHNPASRVVDDILYMYHDSYGRPFCLKNKDYYVNLGWSQHSDLITSTARSKIDDDKFLTSFECIENSNYNLSGDLSLTSDDAFCGDICVGSKTDGSIQISGQFDSRYVHKVSFWAKGTGLVSINNTPITNINGGEWQLITTKIENIPSSINIGLKGTLKIDNLVIAPLVSDNELVTYNNFGSVSSISKNDWNIERYSYDGLGNLDATYDAYGSILGKYDTRFYNNLCMLDDDSFRVDTNVLIFDKDELTPKTVRVNDNSDAWFVENTNTWLKVEREYDVLKVSCLSSNNDPFKRTGIVVLKRGEQEMKITVTQKGLLVIM